MMHPGLPRRNDVLIWSTSALLALLTGLGGAFFLWMALRTTALPLLAHAAVLLVSLGVALVGLAIDRPMARMALLVAAGAIVVGYALGGPFFASLFPT